MGNHPGAARGSLVFLILLSDLPIRRKVLAVSTPWPQPRRFGRPSSPAACSPPGRCTGTDAEAQPPWRIRLTDTPLPRAEDLARVARSSLVRQIHRAVRPECNARSKRKSIEQHLPRSARTLTHQSAHAEAG